MNIIISKLEVAGGRSIKIAYVTITYSWIIHPQQNLFKWRMPEMDHLIVFEIRGENQEVLLLQRERAGI